MQHTQHQQHQQHPFTHIFVGRRSFYLLSIGDVLRLRAVCTWLRDLFRAPQLRQRLSHSLGTQAGLRRTANGRPTIHLLTWDDEQMCDRELLAAVCVIELGGWGEICEVIELAGQCGCCQLPLRLTADDLHQRTNKMAYLAEPRVLAHLKMVDRHIHMGNGVTFQLFEHDNGRLRAIRDQIGFELQVDPPLPPGHLYQRHRRQHDPPVNSRVECCLGDGWVAGAGPVTTASVSSFVKNTLLDHFALTHQSRTISNDIDRHGGSDRVYTILRQSPHAPVEGCTTTTSHCLPGRRTFFRRLVLTDKNSHSFVAWVRIWERSNNDQVMPVVSVFTTEPAVGGGVGDAFKHRFPVTTRLARVVLGPVVAAMVFDR
ncbi:unnamed protein product [Vitrella brassicaformis CCMP3155]|uniref:Uncharacterized protein n=2 Tax=Vitrella brassicaformis TaxID=1169539 RepID=A0A0G4EUS0_VITBC|nr:unnamed protein product [Vitrella brassicaformis CCMP3155]|eukprot:CEM01993.1 unnamed protein product [Vitrella brassicaformis CCMP3155]